MKTVGQVIEELKKFPKDMPVKLLTTNDNGHCHEDPNFRIKPVWTVSAFTGYKWLYSEVKQKIVEIAE